MTDYSVVIPVYNSARFIEHIFFLYRDAFASLMKSFEVIFVDDHSDDSSVEEILKLRHVHSDQVRLLQMNKNYGQYRATVCGISMSRGYRIITMDADASFTLSSIVLILKSIEEKDELAYVEIVNQQRNFFRKAGSKIFNSIIHASLKNNKIKEHSGSSFRVIKRSLALKATESLIYPILLDTALVKNITIDIKFIPMASMLNAGRSSYHISGLLYTGLLLLYASTIGKSFAKLNTDNKWFTEFNG